MGSLVEAQELNSLVQSLRGKVRFHKKVIRDNRQKLHEYKSQIAKLELLASRLGIPIIHQGEGNTHGQIGKHS